MDKTRDLKVAVRTLLKDPTARILSADSTVFEDGVSDVMTGGDGTRLINGVAEVQGAHQVFTRVAKTCSTHPPGADPQCWLYWKREALAFESGLLETLPDG